MEKIFQIFIKKLIILMICVLGSHGECDVCQSTNYVACHKENVYSLCINGKPTRDYITCPENYVCTPDPYVCYPLPEAKPSCVRGSNLCGVCNFNKVYSCLNETTIAFCYGEDKPVEGAEYSYCLEDTVCDLYSQKGFCTEKYLTKPSCVTQDQGDIGNDDTKKSTTTEATTTTEITTTRKPTTSTTTTIQPTTTTTTTELTTSTTEPTTTITKPTTTTTTTITKPNTTTTTTTTEPTTITTTTEPTTTTTTTEPTTTTTTAEPTTTTTTTTTEPTTTSTTTEPTTTEPTTTTTTTEPTTTTTTTTTEPTTTSTTTEPTTTSTTTEPTTTTTTTEPTTSTTTTTTTTTSAGPIDPEVFCKNAATTGSFYAGDRTCKTFVICFETGGKIRGIQRNCPPNQYFPPGIPTKDFITCPENYVCTPDPYVCYPLPEAKPSCVRGSNLCGVCSENKVYACVNETTIAFCYGNDKPVDGADVSYCLGDTVCDIYSNQGFCTERHRAKPSCVTVPEEITTTEATTSTVPPTTTPFTTETTTISTTTETTTKETTTTTTETPTTATTLAPTTPSGPRDPNEVCKDANSTGSFYAGDPTCTTFVVCFDNGGTIIGLQKKCREGQYFPPGAKFCSADKPDICIN
ncbi:uncharacterized protein ACRADG_002906 [Cochliomyia hominivorax]